MKSSMFKQVVSNIKLWLLKSYYSIFGFFLILIIKRKNSVLTQSTPTTLKTYKPIDGKQFIINLQAMEPSSGVTFFKEYKQEIKYWAIGALYNNNALKIKNYG